MDFLLEDEERAEENIRGYWNILIVDDDHFIHEVTKYALTKFTFMNKAIRWYDAYSAEEAKKLLPVIGNVALIFLDVVMETDDAGLQFLVWFRDNKLNPSTRVILRTGQPGQAPERRIIADYDLHDYKTKTELTADKLYTTTVAALRAYNDMFRLEVMHRGLEGIIKASSNLYLMQSINEYANSVLMQIDAILNIRSSGIICIQPKKTGEWIVLGQTGSFVNDTNEIINILNTGENAKNDSYMVQWLSDTNESKFAIYIEAVNDLDDVQKKMLYMFCNNIAAGIKNIHLYDITLKAHKATVTSIGQITEYRDPHTGQHISRISDGVSILAREMYNRGLYPNELTTEVVELIGIASTLHDVGKINTPDNILLKPGTLSDDEFSAIKKHTLMGAEILRSAIEINEYSVDYLEMGLRIAQYHHEKWNGTGYPEGLAGLDIPIEARITSIMDVFDALVNHRCYKEAYSFDKSLEIIAEGRGIDFDPIIVDVFLDVAERIMLPINVSQGV
jgi:response regulator RpfG family c-di-GMP phosphodiesterase